MKINQLARNFILGLIFLLAVLLRLPFLDQVPPALYSDEVSQGYNAYSLITTGKDEYGAARPVSFRSFGDWKPPLATYLMIPTIKLFGLNAWGVRFPSALLGSMSVLIIYGLVIEIMGRYQKTYALKQSSLSDVIALVTAFLLAISPWHILQSRSAMLVGVTSFFYFLGLWSFFRGFKNSLYWLVGGISFVMAIYGYYGMRLMVPLTVMVLCFFFHKELKKNRKTILISAVIAIFLLFPLGFAYIKNSEVIFGRAKTVSIFFDKGIELTQTQLLKEDINRIPDKLAKKFHTLTFSYGVDIMRRFFEHLSSYFLFLVGDTSPPFQIPNMGILYFVDGIFIVIGFVYIVKTNVHLFILISTFIAISIIPAALTFVTPAANRTFTLVFPLLFLAAIGICSTVISIKHAFYKKTFILFLGVTYGISMLFFVRNYFFVLPKDNAQWWHFGYQELFSYLKNQEKQYDTITISSKTSVPYIFLLFYNQVDPFLVKKQIRRNYKDDQFGFEHVDRFGIYEFPRYFEGDMPVENLPHNSLIVLTSDEKIEQESREIQKIYYPNQTVAFRIYEVL